MRSINFIWLIFLTVAFCGCNSMGSQDQMDFEDEIESLNTIESKREYLERILKNDQKVRGGHGQEIMIEHGKHSKEFKEHVQRQTEQDAENLLKIF